MVELRSAERADDRDVVRDALDVREQVRDRGRGLAALLEGIGGAQELGRPLDEREALPLDELLGDGLAVVLPELGLLVEEVDLGGRAGHEEVDHALGPGREVRRLGRERVWIRSFHGRGEQPLVEQAQERQAADAEARLPEEMAPRDRFQPLVSVVHVLHSLVIVSSRFRTTFATMVQAAASSPANRAASSR